MAKVNFYCGRCLDWGTIGFFRKKVCPECNRYPKETWYKNHPRLKGGKVTPIYPWPQPPKKNFDHEVIDDKFYCRPIDKESVNLFVELVMKRMRKKKLNNINILNPCIGAIIEIQKEINNASS